MNKTVPDRESEWNRITSRVSFTFDEPFEVDLIRRHGDPVEHIHVTKAQVSWAFDREAQRWVLDGVQYDWNPTKKDGTRSVAKRSDYMGAIASKRYLPEIIRVATPSINVTTTEAS